MLSCFKRRCSSIKNLETCDFVKEIETPSFFTSQPLSEGAWIKLKGFRRRHETRLMIRLEFLILWLGILWNYLLRKIYWALKTKCDLPQYWEMHMRPISLYNTLYKVISKVLVERLRPIMSKLVGPTQVIFVLGRKIIENVIIAQEMFLKF